jgi:hypothetical protein
MKTRIVPSSELDPRKGLRATDYIPEAAAHENREKRLRALELYRRARQRYLAATGWTQVGRASTDAPMFWRSPYDPSVERDSWVAANEQELKDNELERGR